MKTDEILNEVRKQVEDSIQNTGHHPDVIYMDEEYVEQIRHDLITTYVRRDDKIRNLLFNIWLIAVKEKGHINVV